MATPLEGSAALPLRPALRTDGEEAMSPRGGPVKFVSIAEPEEIPQLCSPEESSRIKQFNAGVAKRMTGRPNLLSNSSSRLSLASQSSIDDYIGSSDPSGTAHQRDGKKHHHHHDRLLAQVAEWLQSEKAKRSARKAKKKIVVEKGPAVVTHEADGSITSRPRTSSQSSNSSAMSLEKLQRILEESLSSTGNGALPPSSQTAGYGRPTPPTSRRRSSVRGRGILSSDTEYQDGDVVVPSADVVLDNSKTMSYTGGTADSSTETLTSSSTSKRAEKERLVWLTFKSEIVRLAHTLRLKGWRRVPLDRGGDIEVERLSGALTNAVYVVSPPEDIPYTDSTSAEHKIHKPRPPPKLLLRIYGPQVEHLIDRENELGILRRLARKKIGPRLLGTFTNGRFEEFFNAQTLTHADLRMPDTSKQIAKRMRELHEGVDLLAREREEGPFVWKNWDKWVDRCEEVIGHLDKQILLSSKGRKRAGKGESWRDRGLICGVEWALFKSTIDKYRKWLDSYYDGIGGVRQKLVFAHNDTQYGNILRLVPEHIAGSAPSPLLLPANEHKQLVVIDFEYASANTPGLEFANHFTEWCYNYHDASKPWACKTEKYPTLEEQRRFVKSYVNHRPQFNPLASATPKMDGKDGLSGGGAGSISAFMLDSRNPAGLTNGTTGESFYAEEEARREKEVARQVDALLQEVRVWRVANSAQWVAWGIVQAKVPELDSSSAGMESEPLDGVVPKVNGEAALPLSDPLTPENEAKRESKAHDKRPEGLVAEAMLQGESAKDAEQIADDEEDEFDYLRYAQDRAMFFWGDVVGLGLVKKEDLPPSLVKRLKIVEY